MSCCGQRRARFAAPLRPEAPPRGGSPGPLPGPMTLAGRRPVLFEYVGATALSARGPRTGRDYRFAAEGVVVEVDPRDAAALDRVPRLRRLR